MKVMFHMNLEETLERQVRERQWWVWEWDCMESADGVSGQTMLRQEEQPGRGLSGVKKHFFHYVVK